MTAAPPAVSPEYQSLKFTLHRKLLDHINLDALAGIDNDQIRGEVVALEHRRCPELDVVGDDDPHSEPLVEPTAAPSREHASRNARPSALNAASATWWSSVPAAST